MGAGLSQKQISDRIYRRMKRKQAELQQAGIPVHYTRGCLTGWNDGRSFTYTMRVIRASNGETTGLPHLCINLPGATETYDWLRMEAGWARVNALFGPVT